MKVIDTAIAEVKIIEPRVFGDARGFFMETWNAHAFTEAGLDLTFVQDKVYHALTAHAMHRKLITHLLRQGFYLQQVQV